MMIIPIGAFDLCHGIFLSGLIKNFIIVVNRLLIKFTKMLLKSSKTVVSALITAISPIASHDIKQNSLTYVQYYSTLSRY